VSAAESEREVARSVEFFLRLCEVGFLEETLALGGGDLVGER